MSSAIGPKTFGPLSRVPSLAFRPLLLCPTDAHTCTQARMHARTQACTHARTHACSIDARPGCRVRGWTWTSPLRSLSKGQKKHTNFFNKLPPHLPHFVRRVPETPTSTHLGPRRKCCSTPPICTTVRPPFVLLCLPAF